MIISKGQFKQLRQSKVDEFVWACIPYLKENFTEWCQGQSDDALKKIIYQVVDIAQKYNIQQATDIQKLLGYKIVYDYDLIKYPNLALPLNATADSENVRIEDFYNSLESEGYKLMVITLNTELSTIDKLN